MDAATITTTTFTLKHGNTEVLGTVTYSGVTAIFTPTSPLAANTLYTAMITTGVEDLAGNALASNYVWSFTTGAAPDITAPAVTLVAPLNNATGVALNTKPAATFTEAMDVATITTITFTLKHGTTSVLGTVTYSGVTAILTPTSPLAANTLYTATITTGVEDLAGNALASNYVWSFTTGAAPDITAPTVTLVAPLNNATGVVLNTKPTATFTEAMDVATITTVTFTLEHGTTAVLGTVTYSGVTAIFTPTSPLAASTLYTATITTGVKDLAGNALASNYVWSFTTGAAPDTTAPTVTLVAPLNNATGIALNIKPTATFTEAMDVATITTITFTLKKEVTEVLGTVTYSGVTAILTPTSPLAANTLYTATITTGAKDLAGNALASNYIWSFTTGAAPDITAPVVTAVAPLNNATGVALNIKPTATFTEAMDVATITTITFTLKHGATSVLGTVTYSGVTAIFTPTSPLAASTLYTATITTGVKDLAGNALASNYIWSFTTGAAPDTIAPTVTLVAPLNNAAGVAISARPAATFSEAMDPATITTITFTLEHGTTDVLGTVTYSGVTAIFTPTSPLAANTLYTATITTEAKDLAGNALASNYVWSFTTGGTAGRSPIVLGIAGNFVILAKSGISTVPTSAVTGDIGVSPIDQTAITGFSETMDATNTFSKAPQVIGKIYAADYAPPTPTLMTAAVSDMEIAYTDAAGRTLPDFTELGAGEIGGLTLIPGLYKWGTDVLISTNVTLQGGPNDVWIFQISGGLTQAAAMRVILTGGALPKNVFWQTFGAVHIGTTAHFEGIILCQTSINLKTGASVNGRLFAQTAVTLDQNQVTQPAP
jgi:hypothetical protein